MNQQPAVVGLNFYFIIFIFCYYFFLILLRRSSVLCRTVSRNIFTRISIPSSVSLNPAEAGVNT